MPLQTKHVESILNLGTVPFGPKVLATDPCYDRSTWCNHLVGGVLPGIWRGFALRTTLNSWGTRTGILLVHHEDHPVKGWSTCWENLSSNVGVDSGQAGLFREDGYPKGSTGEYGDTESFYGQCCEITLANPHAGAIAEGFISDSGIGDGVYDLLGQRDNKGRIVAMALVFIPFSGMWRAMGTPKEASLVA